MENTNWEELFDLIPSENGSMSYSDDVKNFISSILEQEKIKLKEQWLEEILPGEIGYIQHMQDKKSFYYGNGWMDCLDQIKQNAKKLK